ncbi:MAG TPA: DNA primase [Candidatus Latescibacteria bacterium]|nr:DNA primase [Candidatus Latescibacterota bacterium]
MAYRIPEETIAEIRMRNDIVEVVSEVVALKKRGRNYFALCPFHPEKTPSFSVNPDKQIYHCFGCGAGGNVISFIMASQRISFLEAISVLAKRAGISLPEGRSAGRSQHDALYQANDFAQNFYHRLLIDDKRAEKARVYLKERSISMEMIRNFGLGYAPPGWDNLLIAATKRSFPPDVLEKAGLVISKEGGKFYDRFRNRLMFPIQNTIGRTVAFGARSLDDSEGPKYLNSPETPIYHKSAVLYGLARARSSIRTSKIVIVVEGYTDLLRLVQEGFENVVATSGTAFTPEQAKALSHYAEKVILVYDADQAGSAAAVRGTDILLEAGLDVEVVHLPEGHDPDSFIREKGAGQFRELLGEAQDVLKYKLHLVAATEGLATVEGKRKAVATIVETALKIKDEIRRDLLVKGLSEELQIDEEMLHREMARRSRKGRMSSFEPGHPKEGRPYYEGPPAERELLKLMIDNQEILPEVTSSLKPSDFSEPACRAIAQAVFDLYEQGQKPNPAVLIDHLKDPALGAVISKLVLEGYDRAYVKKASADCIRKIKTDVISRKRRQIELRMKKAQEEGDTVLLDKLNREHFMLAKEEMELMKKKT